MPSGADGCAAPCPPSKCSLLPRGVAPQAQGAEPLKIRELYSGSTVHDAGAEFVEPQMTADGQSEIKGQELRFYDSDAALAATYVYGDGTALIGESRRTVLVATAQPAALGAAADPSFTLPAGDRISPAGGAVCFTPASGASPGVCVVWGTFSPPPSLPQPLLTPDSQSAYIADGLSLHRDITRGCTVPFANPTTSTDASFVYAIAGDEPGVGFQCHLDSNPTQNPPATPPVEGEWAACNSQPQIYSSLPDGFHRFWVRAKGENAAWGLPASRAWPESSSGFEAPFSFSFSEPLSSFRCQRDSGAVQVCASNASSGTRSNLGLSDGTHTFAVQTVLGDRTPPDTAVLSGPADPSPKNTASFAYVATEQGSSFECRLGQALFDPCPPRGQSYGPLRNATHTFEVRATDKASNVDSIPASFAWTVEDVAAPYPLSQGTGGDGADLGQEGEAAPRPALRQAPLELLPPPGQGQVQALQGQLRPGRAAVTAPLRGLRRRRPRQRGDVTGAADRAGAPGRRRDLLNFIEPVGVSHRRPT